MNDIQSLAFMAVIVILLFIFAHFVRKWSAPKVKSAEDLERDQLADSLYKMAEYESAAAEAAALSKFHKERAARLKKKGVLLNVPGQKTRHMIVGHNAPPPYAKPPMPPGPPRLNDGSPVPDAY